MNTLVRIAIVALVVVSNFSGASPKFTETREDIIREQVAQGATLIDCIAGKCYDQKGELMGTSDQEGHFLIYPEGQNPPEHQAQVAYRFKHAASSIISFQPDLNYIWQDAKN